MKNRIKKALSLLLTAGVLICMSGAVAFAEEAPAKKRLVYTSIGDSNPAGYGRPDYADICMRVEGAYPALAADVLDAELLQYGWNGFRTKELRYMLDDTYDMTDWNYTQGIGPGRSFISSELRLDKEALTERRAEYREAVKTADLITLQVGVNDILLKTVTNSLPILTEADSVPVKSDFTQFVVELVAAKADPKNPDPVLDDLRQKLLEQDDPAERLVSLLDYAEGIGRGADFIRALTSTMSAAFREFNENYEVIVRRIYELNPDVTLVNVSVLNPFGNTRLKENSAMTLAPLFDPIIRQMNRRIKTVTCRYGRCHNCYYADVSAAETGNLTLITDEDMDEVLKNVMPSIHPSAEGHLYIAYKILEALPQDVTSRKQTSGWRSLLTRRCA